MWVDTLFQFSTRTLGDREGEISSSSDGEADSNYCMGINNVKKYDKDSRYSSSSVLFCASDSGNIVFLRELLGSVPNLDCLY